MTPRRNVAIAWIVVIATVLAVISWFQFLGGRSLRAIVRDDLPWGVVLAPVITVTCLIVVPRVASWLGGSSRFAFWGVLLPTMAACGALGTAAAAGLAYLLGMVPAHAIRVLFMENVSGTVPVTMIIGVAMTLLGTVNARLHATELSLQTQRLERERAEKLAAEAQPTRGARSSLQPAMDVHG